MANKLGRNYVLTIQNDPNDPSVTTIIPPFTLEFDIVKQNHSDGNSANFRIYNLAQDKRAALRMDYVNFGANVSRHINFIAGYGGTMALAFSGSMTRGWSVREGQNFITNIEAIDGLEAITNSEGTTFTFQSGVSKKQIIETMVSFLNQESGGYITKGVIGNYSDVYQTSKTFSGNTVSIIDKEISGGGVFFDNGSIYCLQDSECISGAGFPEIGPNTGILNTPIRETAYVSVEILFEPRIKMGQIVILNSSTADVAEVNQTNIFYKVVGIKHRGMISDAICGDAVTTITLNPNGISEAGVLS